MDGLGESVCMPFKCTKLALGMVSNFCAASKPDFVDRIHLNMVTLCILYLYALKMSFLTY